MTIVIRMRWRSPVAQTNGPADGLVVQVRGVSKVFKRDAFQVTALDDVSINIGPHAASYAHVTRHLEKGMLLLPA